jgi:PAS domain S-box-containing protein
MTLEVGLDRLLEAVIVLDADRKITGWRGAAERLFGYSEAEALGRGVDDLLSPRDANDNPSAIGPTPALSRMRMVKGMPEMEVLTTAKDGREMWLGVTCGIERDGSGAITGTVVVARDINRRKKVDLAKTEVISAVSHEIRSPLTSIKGFTSTLLSKWERFDDETKRHLLLTINSDADRMARLIGELLDVSRLESGRLQLQRRQVDLVELADAVVERLKDRSEVHDLQMMLPGGFPQVYADPDKIEQVLTNLVENAVKYTEEGEVTISGAPEDGHVTVSVSDQGDGIPEAHHSQIFGKFYRRGERSDNPSGTGLGLYISKGLVEAHGGRIWVEEAPGGGARFSFTIPTSRPT